jgi:hypothetical protein
LTTDSPRASARARVSSSFLNSGRPALWLTAGAGASAVPEFRVAFCRAGGCLRCVLCLVLSWRPAD